MPEDCVQSFARQGLLEIAGHSVRGVTGTAPVNFGCLLAVGYDRVGGD